MGRPDGTTVGRRQPAPSATIAGAGPRVDRRGVARRRGTMPSWQATSHGVAWQVDLDRDRLLPGRLMDGTVGVTATDDVDARRLVVTLVGVESWQHEQTSTDGQG